MQLLRRMFARRSPEIQALIVLSIALVAAVTTALLSLQNFGPGGLSGPPQWASDDADYENIGYTLATKGRYAYDWSDPYWRERYAKWNQHGTYSALLGRQGTSPTTYRAPLLPFIIATLYTIGGNSFALLRIFNEVCTMFSVGLTVIFAASLAGVAGAMIAALFLVAHPHLPMFAGMYMTEPVSTLLFVLLLISCTKLLKLCREYPQELHLKPLLVSGFLIGLLLLARSLYILWLPFIGIVILSFLLAAPTRKAAFRIFHRTVIITGLIVAMQLPWWFHNVRTLGHVEPLGSLGMISLSGAYSDGSANDNGLWNYDDYLRVYEEAQEIAATMPSERFEYVWLIHARKAVTEWIAANPEKLPSLALGRVISHFMNFDNYDSIFYGIGMRVFLVLAMLLGAVGWVSRREGWILMFILCVDIFVIAATYNGGGRYLSVVLPALALLTAGIVFLPAELGLSTWRPSPIDMSLFRIRKPGHRGMLKTVALLILSTIASAFIASQAIDYFHRMVPQAGGLNYPPEQGSDDADYDHLAFNLATSSRYEFFWENPDWLARYEPYRAAGQYGELLSRKGRSLTTFHPPFYPFALSLLYRFIGADFALPRLFSLMSITLSVWIAVCSAGLLFGLTAACITAVSLLVFPHLPIFGFMFMSEGLATLLFTLSFLLFFIWRRSSVRHPDGLHLPLGIAAGASFALLAMTRSIYAVWLPFILIAPLFDVLRDRSRRVVVLRRWSAYILVCISLQAPWWIRNSLVTGHFTPLGVQGQAALAGAYSDESFRNHGEWSASSFLAAWNDFSVNFNEPLEKPIDYEYKRSMQLRSVAFTWIRSHISSLPQLFIERVTTHYTAIPYTPYRSSYGLLFLIIVLFGSVALLAEPGGWLFLACVLVDAFVVGMLFENTGRFLVPVLPVLAIAAGSIVRLPRLFKS